MLKHLIWNCYSLFISGRTSVGTVRGQDEQKSRPAGAGQGFPALVREGQLE